MSVTSFVKTILSLKLSPCSCYILYTIHPGSCCCNKSLTDLFRIHDCMLYIYLHVCEYNIYCTGATVVVLIEFVSVNLNSYVYSCIFKWY